MYIELPLFLVFILIIMTVCAVSGVTCCIIDTVMNVKCYRHWKKEIQGQELDKQVGEIVEEKMNLGGGKEPSE